MSSRTFGAVNSTSPSLHGDSEASGRALMGGGENVWIRIIRLMNHYIISRWSSFSLKMPQECPQMDSCMKPILSAMSRQKAFSPRVSWDLCQQMHLQKSTPTTVSFLCQRSMASHNIQVINAYYAVVVPAALEIIFLAKAESGVQRNLSVSPTTMRLQVQWTPQEFFFDFSIRATSTDIVWAPGAPAWDSASTICSRSPVFQLYLDCIWLWDIWTSPSHILWRDSPRSLGFRCFS